VADHPQPGAGAPKSRGLGTTTEQARIRLDELRAGSGRPSRRASTRPAAELDPLLGMSADQFFQVVLLPQGRVRAVPACRQPHRGELLQRLFATERFKAVEDWLVARRVATSATVAAARQDLAVLVARLAQAAGVPAPRRRRASGPPQLLDAARRACAHARTAAQAATSQRDAVRAAAERTARVHALQQRRRAALDRRARPRRRPPGARGARARAQGGRARGASCAACSTRRLSASGPPSPRAPPRRRPALCSPRSACRWRPSRWLCVRRPPMPAAAAVGSRGCAASPTCSPPSGRCRPPPSRRSTA
jgi:exonuclease SbcC